MSIETRFDIAFIAAMARREKDLARYAAASARWTATSPEYVPEQPIPPGDETDRLHRWGYAATESCSTRGSFSAWSSARAASPLSVTREFVAPSPRISPTCSGTRICFAGTTRPR